jgi:predicted P-loop ATPase
MERRGDTVERSNQFLQRRFGGDNSIFERLSRVEIIATVEQFYRPIEIVFHADLI